ncbi:MAG: phosphoglycerate mutase [Sneathiella sp.]|nr:MAG: phosphoglycerate mutase [Sneathiella sp.]
MHSTYSQKNWWLVRHAPVITDILYGHTDLPADFSDTERLAALGRTLPATGAIYSSDLQRCFQTAELIFTSNGGESPFITKVASLREQHFGEWEGRKYEETEASSPSEYHSFWEEPALTSPPGGESFANLVTRVAAQVDAMLSLDAADIVMVVHAGTIRAILGTALGMTPARMLSFAIAPLSLTHLRSFSRDGTTTWQVSFVNNQGHELPTMGA